MPKYEYEILDETGEVLGTTEFWQGINDATLEVHPETGKKLRRILSCTTTLGSQSPSSAAAPASSAFKGCGGGCKCAGH